MKKLLCFCVVCNMMIAATSQKNIQGKFVSQYVNIIDPNNKILRPDRKATESSAKEKEVTGIKGFDASTISKIVSGQTILKLSNIAIPETYNSDIENRLKKVASSWFTEENKSVLTVALLEVIKEDTYIDEHKDSFKKFFGMTKEEFLNKGTYSFWELMVQVLFYTTLSGIDKDTQGKYLFDNKDSSKINNKIFKEYISGVENRYTESIYTWDTNTATLTIKKDGKEADNSLINTVIRSSMSNTVETAAVSIESSNNGGYFEDNVRESTITIDKKYMVCEYCSKFCNLKDNNNPNLGKCSISSRNYYKNNEGCKSFSPKYGKITLDSLKEKFFK